MVAPPHDPAWQRATDAMNLASQAEAAGDCPLFQAAAAGLADAVALAAGSPVRDLYVLQLGYVLLKCYENCYDSATLDKALVVLDEAVQQSQGDPSLAQEQYSRALLFRGQRDGSANDMKCAVSVLTNLLRLAPMMADRRKRERLVSYRASALAGWVAFEAETVDLDVIQAAVEECQDAADASLPDDWTDRLNLARVLEIRGQRTRNADDLTTAASTLASLVEASLPEHPLRPATVRRLAFILLSLPEELPDLLSSRILAFSELLQLAPAEDPHRSFLHAQLGTALIHQYEVDGSPDSLVASVEALRQAVETADANEPGRALWNHNLGSQLYVLSTTSEGREADLQLMEAAQHFGQAFRLAEDGDPAKHDYAVALMTCLRIVTHELSRPDQLDELVEVLQWLVTNTPQDDDELPVYRYLLTTYQLGDSRSSRDAEIAQEAARHFELLAEQAGADDKVRAGSLMGRLAALGKLVKEHGDDETVDRALQAALLALDHTVTGTEHDLWPLTVGFLVELVPAVTNEHHHRAMQIAITQARATAKASEDETSIRERLTLLSTLLREYGTRVDEEALLEEATDLAREAGQLRMRIPDDPFGALVSGFHEFADLTLIDEAVLQIERDVARHPEPGPERQRRLELLVLALFQRYSQTYLPRDAALAERFASELVDAARASGHRLGEALFAAALGFWSRFVQSKDLNHLSQAMNLLSEAAESASSPSKRSSALSLASVLGKDLYRRTEDVNDLRACLVLAEQAFAAAEEAGAAASADHATMAQALHLLGRATADQAMLERAAAHAKSAAALSQAEPVFRRYAMHSLWATISASAHHWDDAMRAYQLTIELASLFAPRQLSPDDLQRQIAMLADLPGSAAACALMANAPETCLDFLEQTRGRLLAYTMDARTDLGALADAQTALADQISALLEGSNSDGPQPSQIGHVQNRSDNRRNLDRALGDARKVPGFERLLLTPDCTELVGQARAGATVVLNAAEERCDAILITEDGVRVVCLPLVTHAKLKERADRFALALELAENHSLDVLDRAAGHAIVMDVLAWAWHAVAEPVLAALGHTATLPAGSALPRVWWLPTGHFTRLPIHAAADHDDEQAVINRVVSSYTPTLRSLSRARSQPVPVRRQLATAAMPETRGLDSLPHARRELERIRELTRFPGPEPLIGDEANTAAVMSAIASASLVHIGCHARHVPADPFQSRLELADGPLTVRAISRLDLPEAELAYLSACNTARGESRIADEALHIVSGFHLAGFQQVIGTLWAVDDRMASEVAVEFHRGLTTTAGDEPLPAAVVLHDVTRRLRDGSLEIDAPRSSDWRRPWFWGSLIHVGR